MTPPDDKPPFVPLADLVRRTLGGRLHDAVRRRLIEGAISAANTGVPGPTLDAWLDEAREAYRAQTIVLANGLDGVK